MAKRTSTTIDATAAVTLEQLVPMLTASLPALKKQVEASPIPVLLNDAEVGRVINAAQTRGIGICLSCRIQIDDRSLIQRLRGAAFDMKCARLDAIWLEGAELVLVRGAIAPPVVAVSKPEASKPSESSGEGKHPSSV